ncbi:protocadherin gamma-B4-like isoform X22 [Bufo gargarizans]|uniref:protocadherin gamma-B4-like isoform X22 n=1 Tax=Bufo gargarizans TaxID=30331 RepID=UPI001CF2E72F|nr:protocadherin gamma-B4-like isoform X22 [Bufo gargarizans]
MARMAEIIQWRTMKWQVMFFYLLLLYLPASGQVQYSILEEMRQGSVIGNIAKDLGFSPNELASRKLQFASHTKRHYFNISMENGDLYISDRIDREAICGAEKNCVLHLEVLVSNPVNVFHITVEIQDINDNSPSFSKKMFKVGISEAALVGTHVALGNARDPDLGKNSLQGYTLSPNQHFKLGERVNAEGIKYPELVLEKSLDREKQNLYEFTLTAVDGGSPEKSGTALIRIVVLDSNDNFPKFNQDTYRVTLLETTSINSLALCINATDEDEGINAQITYSFSHIPENAIDKFKLDSYNGEIITVGELDYEVTKSYEVTVEAKDGGGLVSHCTILIQISDVNDNAPEIIFASPITSVPEDSPPETLIALINVKDLDYEENGEVTCQIDETPELKLIPSSHNYYKLVTARHLDREAKSVYNVTLTAEDRGNPPMSAKTLIHVSVTDVNDNSPVFDKTIYVVYVSEYNQPGSSLYNIHASDLDDKENAQIMYSIISSNIENIPVLSYVSINSMTGVLYAQRSFDYEKLREFQFQVMAKDSGSPPLSSNVTVRICIIDKNDNAPKILYPSPDTEGSALFEFIPHFAEKGYLVTKVIAVDADSGHNAWLSYHLLQVPDPSLFTIEQHSGEIRIGRDFQDIDSSRQKIVVLVKDNGAPSLSSTVTLTLVVAESFQEIPPEIKRQPTNSDSSNLTFYLVVSIAFISLLFFLTIIVVIIAKCRKAYSPTTFGAYNRNVYPQFTLECPSEISDTSLPFPFTYDVCVTLDSKQNEIAYLKPVQNVPTDNLIDTEETVVENNVLKNNLLSVGSPQQAQPGAEWRFSQAQRPGPSGAQPAEEAGVWPNNQFETERLQAMILASANEAAEGTSGLGGGTGTMGLSARYGPQFTLQHVPDYRQNVYIPGSTLTPTNAGGKRDGKGGGNKKKSGKKEKK